ncbi:uncharacterized protein [Clytia hemisphaerica]|uniref:Uncharacterized protein n=1 Tax=Clytia hemisphaerica TaxID=252671 RepID=A0A7M5XLA4_9CNID|eukprot:TCONS_00028725-protein
MSNDNTHLIIETKDDVNMKKEGIQQDEVSENIIYTQVELSHGSTTNQPTMYQGSSTESVDYRTRVFCCDLIFVMFLFVSSVFLILFHYDHIPSLDRYFKTHPHYKEMVLALSCVIIAIVFLIFIFRCGRRTWMSRCTESLRKRKARKIYRQFQNSKDQIDGGEATIAAPVPQVVDKDADWTPGLSDLQDKDLEEIRFILSKFLAYHDESDWLFSPSTVSTISRRGGFTENRNFEKVKETVRIKVAIKLILVGQPNVGKTSIFHRILYDRFSEYYMATLGADLAHVCLHLYPGQPDQHVMISLQLWDIAGSERFSELSHIVYKDATAFIVICDITNKDSVSMSEPWVKDITQSKYDPYVALFFNKIDLTSEVNEQNSMTLLTNPGVTNTDDLLRNLDMFPVSAKTGEKVLENVIKVLIKSIIHEADKLL